jgi:2-dehydropantoate 2-reductase
LEIVGEDGSSSSVADVTIVSSPAEVVGGTVDVVFLTVKATDTASASGWLGPLCSASTVVVVVQNGLDQADRAAPYLPPGVVAVPGLAYLAAERLSAGRVRHLAGSLLIVPSEVVDRVAPAVPGLKVRGTDDVVTACWQKLLGNLVANPITALTMRRITVMGEPGIADLARALLREAVAVGRASGTAQYGPDTGSSMLYDRMAGRPMEHQFLTGEVVRRGGALGIPTPMNAALLALLEAIDRKIT